MWKYRLKWLHYGHRVKYRSLLILFVVNIILFAFIYFRYLREESAINTVETDIDIRNQHVPGVSINRQHWEQPFSSDLRRKYIEKSQKNRKSPVLNGELQNQILNSNAVINSTRTFTIDFEKDVFVKDGKPFQYISGSFHYFRTPRAYWQDRLRKLRAAGLNAISTYVEWSLHEPSPRSYKFSDEEDIEHFIQLAVEEDLLVILRPGPYICAERDFGGLPPWLLTKYPNIELRTNDADYMKEVQKWLDVLMSRLKRYLYGNGGPIIMVQIENEYGSYKACNNLYTIWLRDLMISHVGNAAVLFTTDGNAVHYLQCGRIEGIYSTIDFGTSANVNQSFQAMRTYAPKGPLVNSEFYPGWLSHWDEEMQTISTNKILDTLNQMLKLGANVNFYMFFGGTNFGFTNGANYFSDDYQPQLTSYDYDAPLDEAGDPTFKYFAIREEIGKYFKLPNIPLPKIQSKGAYGKVMLRQLLSVFDWSFIPDAVIFKKDRPATFEELGIYYGYVLYETWIPENIPDPANLYIQDLRDRAVIFVEHTPVGVLSRATHTYSMPLIGASGRKLSFLVENQGRINFGNYMKDPKGLLSDPLISGKPLLQKWTMVGLPLKSVSWVERLLSSPPSKNNSQVQGFYVGELVLPKEETPKDTYVDLSGWGKGVIFINDFNLGRYWPAIGSQVTLYVPGCKLRPAPEINLIVVFETEYTPMKHLEITFTDKPILNKIPPNKLMIQP